MKLEKQNQTAEVTRRIGISWVAFGKLHHVFKNPKITINLKEKIYDACVLPVATNGLATKTLKKHR